MREVASGSLPVSRNDTAATLKRMIVAAPISPMKTRWRTTSTLDAGFIFRSIIVVFITFRPAAWGIRNCCRVASSTAASGQSTTVNTKCSTILGEIFSVRNCVARRTRRGRGQNRPSILSSL